MSFGKMNTFISIVEKQFTQDDEGFKTETDVTVAEVRAYREGRHGSEKWANMASFSTATDLFQFRVIPGVTVTTDMRILCDGHTFEITSVEDVKGRIKPGYYADMVLLDRDIFTVDPAEIKDIRPVMTMVGGKVVYESRNRN